MDLYEVSINKNAQKLKSSIESPKVESEERFRELMSLDKNCTEKDVDKVFEGLKILSKYTKQVISRAEHDMVWCGATIQELMVKGITEHEVMNLNYYGFIIDDEDDSIFSFV